MKQDVPRDLIDQTIQKGMKKVEEIPTVEIAPGVHANKKSLSWFINKMFNPEDNLWIWIRRIANILTIPTLILVIIGLFV